MSGGATESGFADVNRTRLYYEARGSGPALLLLHGFTLDHRMWGRQVEALSDRCRVVVYDARGFGRSAMPVEGEPYRHCDDAAALSAHLGLVRVTAVGHSVGAYQMLELALDRPDLVAGWGSVCMAGLAGVPFPDDITRMFADIQRAAREQSLDAARDIWRRCDWFTPAREDVALAAELDRMLADYGGWHWTHDNPAQSLDPPAAARLGELRAPALVVTGGRDLDYNATIARQLLDGIRSVVGLRLPEVGHMANLEAPDAITAAIAALVERGTAWAAPVWVIGAERGPRAALRAELLERGHDALGFESLRDALLADRLPPHPALVVLDLHDQPLDAPLLDALFALGAPVIAVGGTADATDAPLHARPWSHFLRRPLTLGTIADTVDALARPTIPIQH